MSSSRPQATSAGSTHTGTECSVLAWRTPASTPGQSVARLEGGFDEQGRFHHVPFGDLARMAQTFRRRVLALFLQRGLIERHRAEGLLCWKNSGFSLDYANWNQQRAAAYSTDLMKREGCLQPLFPAETLKAAPTG